ncbi:phosphoacetylglucosamine mutase-like [Panonychus citri]|uniref:phosphoacetylglucosamine mutase-like n=1 Tax=Panonychus citri TaxID=50023 RepID=UPI00230763A0|nr:phosphoacetylglucosamine mutase-like [Panonychus citri]
MDSSTEQFTSVASKYPKKYPEVFAYGTSGIRCLGHKLDSTAFRLGIVAGLRSQINKGKAVGLMITASHNPSDDNGIKCIDSHGSMLDEEWEPICTKLANLPDEELKQSVDDLIKEHQANGPSLVFIGIDTRGTSAGLAKAATDGAKIVGAEVRHFGLVTTPQLHYMVYTYNLNEGDPTEQGYYNKVSSAFKELCSAFKEVPSNYVPILNLDCANGVGACSMKKLVPLLEPFLQVKLHNTCEKGMVNFECGSSYVETTFRQPYGCAVKPDEHWASFDGDADRIIFYYRNSDSKLRILNGDKIAALFCIYIKELVTACELSNKLTIQVIQTAYSNGRTAEFLRDTVGVRVVCTPTGVKHLMRRTSECDISIWFESNGHGSIRYSDRAYEIVKEKASTDSTGSANLLIKIFNLMNQATGDAISDFLLVEAILRAKDWDPKNWDAVYTTYPSRLMKLKVPDRNFIKTNDIATIIYEPESLQQDISKLIETFGPGSRTIVRASGTEDCVRIYTESTTQDNADQLAEQIVLLVTKYSGLKQQRSEKLD